MATADYSLMSLLLFFFFLHTPVRSVMAANLGQTHYTVTVQVYPWLYNLVPLPTVELVKHWSTTQTPISAEHQYGGHDNVITFT